MSNYNKSFNFKNGVQVDYDNFVVNANGLVGIGTSIPTEFLDVYGTAKITGLVNSTNITTPLLSVSGIGTIQKLDVGITSIRSGIITASTGIITYYGDGGRLINLPTSQWLDIDVGLGFTSIYNRGYVGVATNDPRYYLQIGGNISNSQNGVGIDSIGNISASSSITGYSFSGFGTNLTGLSASNITFGTLLNSVLPSSINISGVITASTFNGNVNSGVGTFNNVIVGGATTQLIVNGNARISGVLTATSFTGNVTGTASTAQSLTGTPNISVGTITATSIGVGFATIGIATITELDVGIGGTAFTALISGRIGVGTALPTSEFQIRKSESSLLEVISDISKASISIGQSVGIGKSTGQLRFGNSPRTFDIINNDTGNINLYLHNGPAGVGTGRFAWIYGQSNQDLASLTYDGKFGIGITNPTNTLHVVGTSTVTEDAYFRKNVNVYGTLTAETISFPSIIPNVNLNVSTGVSTVRDLVVQDKVTINFPIIGIATNNPIVGVDARTSSVLVQSLGINTNAPNNNNSISLYVTGQSIFDSVGVGTTTQYGNDKFSVYNNNIGIYNSPTVIQSSSILADNNCSVGIGTTVPLSTVDFSSCGPTTLRYMITPKASTTTRNTFINTLGVGTVLGAIIYNTTTNKHQGYGSTNNGVTFGWQDLY